MRLWRRRSYLLRLFITYMLVLIFPIVVLGIITERVHMRALKDMMVERAQSDLARTADSFDALIEQYKTIALRLCNDRRIMTANLTGNSVGYLGAYESLRSYVGVDQFASQILMYNKKDGKLYANAYVYNTGIFYRSIQRYDPGCYDAFTQALGALSNPAFFRLPHATDAPPDVVLAIPIHGLSGGDNVLLCFFSHARLSALTGAAADGLAATLLYAADGLLFAGGSVPAGVEEMPMPLADTAGDLRLNGTVYAVSTKDSKTMDLRYAVLTPIQTLFADLRSIQAARMISLAAVLAVGLVLVTVFSRKNFKPLGNLSAKARALVQVTDKSLDEFGYASAAMESLYQAGERERALTNLLYERIDDPAQAETFLYQAGMPACSQQFCVLVALRSVDRHDAAMHALEARLAEAFSGVCRFEYTSSKIVFLLGWEREVPEAELRKLYQALPGRLQKPVLGVGSCCAGAGGIAASFSEAKVALEYAIYHQMRGIVFFRETAASEEQLFSYPSEELMLLSTMICSGDVQQSRTIGRILFRYLHEHQDNVFQAVRLCHEMISTVHLALGEAGIEAEELKRRHSTALLRQDAYLPEQMFETVSRFFDEAIEAMEEAFRPQKSARSIDSVVAYINNNFSDSGISVKVIAHRFDISVSNLSHQFKNKTGKNVSQYIDELRLALARQLLKTTSLTISHIAANTGYISSANLIRKFKQHYSLTPAEFRRSG